MNWDRKIAVLLSFLLASVAAYNQYGAAAIAFLHHEQEKRKMVGNPFTKECVSDWNETCSQRKTIRHPSRKDFSVVGFIRKG